MRAKDGLVGLAAFLIGHVVGAKATVRLWLDLSNQEGDPSALGFVVQAPKTLLLLGVVPFLVVLWMAGRRLALSSVAAPSFLSGFLWLALYSAAVWAGVFFLHAGRPPRLGTGLVTLGLIVAAPALAEYGVFAAWARLAKRPRPG